jgi:hypothetical protein
MEEGHCHSGPKRKEVLDPVFRSQFRYPSQTCQLKCQEHRDSVERASQTTQVISVYPFVVGTPCSGDVLDLGGLGGLDNSRTRSALSADAMVSPQYGPGQISAHLSPIHSPSRFHTAIQMQLPESPFHSR